MTERRRDAGAVLFLSTAIAAGRPPRASCDPGAAPSAAVVRGGRVPYASRSWHRWPAGARAPPAGRWSRRSRAGFPTIGPLRGSAASASGGRRRSCRRATARGAPSLPASPSASRWPTAGCPSRSSRTAGSTAPAIRAASPPPSRRGQTAYLPQVHQVLPRLMRLIVALRAALLGPGREESSFLFIVQGTGRRGMGLHHDGEVDAFWLQLEGRRTVTVGPRVRPGTRRGARRPAGARRPSRGMAHLRPRARKPVPPAGAHPARRGLPATLAGHHAHVGACREAGHGRPTGDRAPSLGRGVRDSRSRSRPPSPRTLWVQVPRARRAGRGARPRSACGPRTARGHACPGRRARGPRGSASCRASRATLAQAAGLSPLVGAGILGPRDLPLRIRPEDPIDARRLALRLTARLEWGSGGQGDVTAVDLSPLDPRRASRRGPRLLRPSRPRDGDADPRRPLRRADPVRDAPGRSGPASSAAS